MKSIKNKALLIAAISALTAGVPEPSPNREREALPRTPGASTRRKKTKAQRKARRVNRPNQK